MNPNDIYTLTKDEWIEKYTQEIEAKKKSKAKKAWNEAIKTTPAEVIIEGLKRYNASAEVAKLLKEGKEHLIPDPDKWIKAKGWLNDYPPETISTAA